MRHILLAFSTIALSGCLSADPHTFSCGDRLEGFMGDYNGPQVIASIQRDAGGDYTRQQGNGAGQFDAQSAQRQAETNARIEQSIVDALRSTAPYQATMADDASRGSLANRPALLILSGGGQWGAYGAGFLNAWSKDEAEFAGVRTVTGISTGAMQSILVAAGDFDMLKQAYAIERQSDLAEEQGVTGLVRRGSLYDTQALRTFVENTLCPANAADCPILDKLRDEHAPTVLIGMVEARSGNLKIVDVTGVVRNSAAQSAADNREIASCVAGVVMASSAVPGQLRPVQIDGTTYVDGGVRSSVIAATFARVLAENLDDPTEVPPHVVIMRNGPTVVPPGKTSDGDSNVAAVDARPDVLAVGSRSYSTIVNQNELSSIALIRDEYPRAHIFLTTADGFSSEEFGQSWEPSGQDMAFDPDFMKHLIDWGEKKYARAGTPEDRGSRWIVIPPLKDEN